MIDRLGVILILMIAVYIRAVLAIFDALVWCAVEVWPAAIMVGAGALIMMATRKPRTIKHDDDGGWFFK